MSELRIESLRLRHFKGVGLFALTPDGGDADVLGDNATGKTTLFDAFTWLLFDKDSDNRKEFDIKTLDEGHALHGLEHEVEGVLDLDGVRLSLRKVYSEKWTKKRGSAEKQFSGNTTDHFIDGVPVKKKEYAERISGIADETIFRLLTDPANFNVQMHWEDRRRLLLDVCGDITDTDVIASDDALEQLPEILGDRSLEDHRKVIASRRSEINKELERIPVRIDEVSQGLPETSGSRKTIEDELQKLRLRAQEKHKEKARLEAGGQIAEKTKQLRELEAEHQAMENSAKAEADEENRAIRQAIAAIKTKIDELDRQVGSRERDIESNDATIQRLEKRMEALRDEWHAIDSEVSQDTTETVCAACGQDLPAHKVDGAREKALAAFNADKARCLEANVEEGKQAKAEAGDLSLANDRLHKEIADLEAGRDKLKQEKESLPVPADEDITMPPEYYAKLEEVEAIKDEIAKLQDGNAEALTEITQAISDLQAQIREQDAALAAFSQVEQAKERIDELKAQEKQLAAEYEQLEKELYLTEQFTRAKVRLLDQKINSRFQMARFKLFNELVNGAIEECCETTYQGVSYPDLNNGARINVGLDIINTLQSHYGVRAPVFIDNSESITSLTDTRSQMIRLVVSGSDKKLRVETQTAKQKAVA